VSLFDDPYGEPSHALSAEQVGYLRWILDAHGNGPASGGCRVCGVPSCPDWRDSYDQLAADGQLMAEPERWSGPVDRDGAP
jgi:hypothetical protein